MVLTEGFLPGIARGGACLAYCAPVLVPYLLGGVLPVGNARLARINLKRLEYDNGRIRTRHESRHPEAKPKDPATE